MMPASSQLDQAFWEENGYVIIRDVVSPKNIKYALKAIWEFSGMDSNDPGTWNSPHLHLHFVDIFQHQALWNNRQSPRIHRAFAKIWRTEKLWVSFSPTSINLPTRQALPKRWQLHWDMSLKQPFDFGVGGVLYLTDTTENQGALTLVPGFHNYIEKWLDSLPSETNPTEEDLHSLGSKPIAANAGDLIIWHKFLPHGASSNTTNTPRLVQYIGMSPVSSTIWPGDCYQDARDCRIKAWQERRAGFDGDRLEKESQMGQTAALSSLGRKLLGLDCWDEPDSCTKMVE